MLTPKTFKKLCQDPRVDDWSDERSRGSYNEGIWLYLAPGWVTGEGLLEIHETTVKDCAYELMLTRYSPDEWAQAMGAPGGLLELLPGA